MAGKKQFPNGTWQYIFKKKLAAPVCYDPCNFEPGAGMLLVTAIVVVAVVVWWAAG